VIGPLLEQAATQARTTPTATELAAAVGQTAYLLGALRQAGEHLGILPPTRCWSACRACGCGRSRSEASTN
jgi:hypothetical protein